MLGSTWLLFLQCPQGYLLSGVTATLADQLGSAVFYSSGVGFSGVSLEISVSYVDTATIGVSLQSLSLCIYASNLFLFVNKDFSFVRIGNFCDEKRDSVDVAVHFVQNWALHKSGLANFLRHWE